MNKPAHAYSPAECRLSGNGSFHRDGAFSSKKRTGTRENASFFLGARSFFCRQTTRLRIISVQKRCGAGLFRIFSGHKRAKASQHRQEAAFLCFVSDQKGRKTCFFLKKAPCRPGRTVGFLAKEVANFAKEASLLALPIGKHAEHACFAAKEGSILALMTGWTPDSPDLPSS